MLQYFPVDRILLFFAVYAMSADHGYSNDANRIHINNYKFENTCTSQKDHRSDRVRPFWFRGQWFAIPNNFVNPWDISNSEEEFKMENYTRALAKNSERTGFDVETGAFNEKLLTSPARSPTFSFWWPSRDPVSCDLRFIPPISLRRTKNDNENSVVRFRLEWPDIKKSGRPPSSKKFGPLDRFRRSGLFKEYDKGGMLALLTCAAGRECNGWVWDKSEDISIFIIFTERTRQRDGEHFWYAPAATSIDLVKQWLAEGRAWNGE